ncbi:FAD binding domain-containing protein [Mycobacterium marinum]|uniref:FAD binding domain-containing protein n=1 Tax=Mycobacterium marinum TaxID=1781 RepID=UPI003561BE9D
MKDFGYARSADIASALATLGHDDTTVIAGGTELLNWYRLGIAVESNVLDIGGLQTLRDITRQGDELVIGALATLNDVADDPTVNTGAGALSSACRQAASAQLRNRATMGGNALQRTRCPYFRAEEPLPWGCNKRTPGTGCSSLAGQHERQAIFGWTNDCVAVHPSDPAVALAALDAQVEVTGVAEQRSIAMTQFHLSQQEAAATGDPQRESRLKPGELITGYRLRLRPDEGQAYVKVRERASYEYAIVSAAAAVRTSHGVIVAARLALGSVAQRPWRLYDAESELVGLPLHRKAVLPVVERALTASDPLPDNGFKVVLAARAAVRALLTAGGTA